MAGDLNNNGAAHASPVQRSGYASSFHEVPEGWQSGSFVAEAGAVHEQ